MHRSACEVACVHKLHKLFFFLLLKDLLIVLPDGALQNLEALSNFLLCVIIFFSLLFFSLLSKTPPTSISFICCTDNELISHFFLSLCSLQIYLTINNLSVFSLPVTLAVFVSFLTNDPTSKSLIGSQNELQKQQPSSLLLCLSGKGMGTLQVDQHSWHTPSWEPKRRRCRAHAPGREQLLPSAAPHKKTV